MKIKVRQLKQFNSVASGVKKNTILPILSFLKFDKGTVTKNNLESFVTMEIDFEGSCLIDEKILIGFIDSIEAEEIDVEVKGNTVVLSHGKRKVSSPTDQLEFFPSVPVPDNELDIFISQDLLKSIKVASNFTMDLEGSPYASCVHIGGGLVGATSGFIAYVEPMDEKLPDVVLEKNMVAVLKGLEFALFNQSDSYVFLKSGNFVFGFIKKDTKFLNMGRFKALPEGEPTLMPKKEFEGFCDLCNDYSVGKSYSLATVKGKELSMVDVDYGIDCKEELPVSLPDFSFNPAYMGKLLKALPDENLKFLKDQNKYYITGEKGNYVSLIMELA